MNLKVCDFGLIEVMKQFIKINLGNNVKINKDFKFYGVSLFLDSNIVLNNNIIIEGDCKIYSDTYLDGTVLKNCLVYPSNTIQNSICSDSKFYMGNKIHGSNIVKSNIESSDIYRSDIYNSKILSHSSINESVIRGSFIFDSAVRNQSKIIESKIHEDSEIMSSEVKSSNIHEHVVVVSSKLDETNVFNFSNIFKCDLKLVDINDNTVLKNENLLMNNPFCFKYEDIVIKRIEHNKFYVLCENRNVIFNKEDIPKVLQEFYFFTEKEKFKIFKEAMNLLYLERS